MIRESGIPYTIVRPCALTEEPAGADVIFDQGDNITVNGILFYFLFPVFSSIGQIAILTPSQPLLLRIKITYFSHSRLLYFINSLYSFPVLPPSRERSRGKRLLRYALLLLKAQMPVIRPSR